MGFSSIASAMGFSNCSTSFPIDEHCCFSSSVCPRRYRR